MFMIHCQNCTIDIEFGSARFSSKIRIHFKDCFVIFIERNDLTE